MSYENIRHVGWMYSNTGQLECRVGMESRAGGCDAGGVGHGGNLPSEHSHPGVSRQGGGNAGV